MKNEKIKIIEANYDSEKKLAKVKVCSVDTGKNKTWALTGDSFDSLISQITGRSFQYDCEQREILCSQICGIEFMNMIEIDIENIDIEKSKDKNISELQHYHDTVDMYPFYEIQQEAIEESLHQKGE